MKRVTDTWSKFQSSEEDMDLSDSEMEAYEDISYKELKNGDHDLKNSNGEYECPYCPKKRKRDYIYNEILDHASGVGKSRSQKRSAKENASLLPLMKYLEKDLVATNGSSKPAGEAATSSGCDEDEKFVWPWTGIVVNIPTPRLEDGREVRDSGSKFRDELRRRGFNPIRVYTLWNYEGFSGTALVEFHKDWPGLHDAILFEKDYEVGRHGKKDWCMSDGTKAGLYAWVARSDDYNSGGIIGGELRKIGDLKTISQIMDEEERKQESIVSNLTNVIEQNSKHMKDIAKDFSETESAINELIEEKDKLNQSCNEGEFIVMS